jgi:hypothetical protein
VGDFFIFPSLDQPLNFTKSIFSALGTFRGSDPPLSSHLLEGHARARRPLTSKFSQILVPYYILLPSNFQDHRRPRARAAGRATSH